MTSHQLLLTSTPTIPRTLLFSRLLDSRALHSFPTRRSSDLVPDYRGAAAVVFALDDADRRRPCLRAAAGAVAAREIRKSTRLNSSHVSISYAVFCLKKKDSNAG